MAQKDRGHILNLTIKIKCSVSYSNGIRIGTFSRRQCFWLDLIQVIRQFLTDIWGCFTRINIKAPKPQLTEKEGSVTFSRKLPLLSSFVLNFSQGNNPTARETAKILR